MALARALYEPAPNAEAMGAFGFKPEDFDEDPPVDVWPENWAAYRLFTDNQSQWVHGPGGPTGLNYLVIFACLDRMGLDEDAREDLMYCIRVLEIGALAEIHRDKE